MDQDARSSECQELAYSCLSRNATLSDELFKDRELISICIFYCDVNIP